MYSTDKELLKILVDYSDDLATLKMRQGRLPAQVAIHRILALQNNAVVAARETGYLEGLRDGKKIKPVKVSKSELTKKGHKE